MKILGGHRPDDGEIRIAGQTVTIASLNQADFYCDDLSGIQSGAGIVSGRERLPGPGDPQAWRHPARGSTRACHQTVEGTGDGL